MGRVDPERQKARALSYMNGNVPRPQKMILDSAYALSMQAGQAKDERLPEIAELLTQYAEDLAAEAWQAIEGDTQSERQSTSP